MFLNCSTGGWMTPVLDYAAPSIAFASSTWRVFRALRAFHARWIGSFAITSFLLMRSAKSRRKEEKVGISSFLLMAKRLASRRGSDVGSDVGEVGESR